MVPLRVTLVFSAALVSQALAQELSAAESDIASLRSQTTITSEPIIIDDPSVTFDEIDQAGEHRSITAAEYADFLNSKAVTDAENLYDEKMGSDPEAACIIRRGLPGDYSYEVIAGREDVLITYPTKNAEEEYCVWLQQQQTTHGVTTAIIGLQSDNDDISMASNHGGIFIITENNCPLLNFNINTITHLSTREEVIGGTAATIILAIVAWETCRPRENVDLDNIWGEPLSTSENRVFFSKEKSDVLNLENEQVPIAGSFQAGKVLRQHLSETTKATILQSLTQPNQDGMKALSTDLGRASFTIHSKGENREALDKKTIFQNFFRQDSKKKAIKRFKTFVGLKYPLRAKAIARIMNQTLFADVECMIHQLPHQLSQKSFSSKELKPLCGVFTMHAPNQPITAYDLEKKRDNSFVLTATYKHKAPVADMGPWLKRSYFFSYDITDNDNFLNDNPINEKNFPCGVECKDFQLRYEILKKFDENK